jgi:hypothetical protein
MAFRDLVMEEMSPGGYLEHGQNGTLLSFLVRVETGEQTTWILMPRAKEYRDFGIVRHLTGKPETAEPFRPVTEFLPEDYTILAFKMVALKPGYTYEVLWRYK